MNATFITKICKKLIFCCKIKNHNVFLGKNNITNKKTKKCFKMKQAKVIFKIKNEELILECNLAKTLLEQTKGLMNIEHLPENKGMLFDFKIPWHRFFWMKNVKIPLDIIFVNKSLEILHISEANVEKRLFYKNYWSHGFCKYVIETNIGFCKKNNISKGIKIKIKKEN